MLKSARAAPLRQHDAQASGVKRDNRVPIIVRSSISWWFRVDHGAERGGNVAQRSRVSVAAEFAGRFADARARTDCRYGERRPALERLTAATANCNDRAYVWCRGERRHHPAAASTRRLFARCGRNRTHACGRKRSAATLIHSRRPLSFADCAVRHHAYYRRGSSLRPFAPQPDAGRREAARFQYRCA